MKYATHRLFVATVAAAMPAFGSTAANPGAGLVALAQDPLVMRLSKDEFRIAFGLQADRCATRGCSGIIRYQVEWRAEDGTSRSEIKRISYRVVPRSNRAITVDRQYFDTAEAAHTTEVLRIHVEQITCLQG